MSSDAELTKERDILKAHFVDGQEVFAFTLLLTMFELTGLKTEVVPGFLRRAASYFEHLDTQVQNEQKPK